MQTSPDTECGIIPSRSSTHTCSRQSRRQDWQRTPRRGSKGCWLTRTALLHSYMMHRRFKYAGMSQRELSLLHRTFCRFATSTTTIATSPRSANHLPNSPTPSQCSRAATCKKRSARSFLSCRKTDTLKPCHRGIGTAPSGVSALLWMTGTPRRPDSYRG